MQRRSFGKTNEEVSVLAFGAMRLPTIDGVNHRIDEDKAVSMIRHAIDEGVNYVDTAYPYHGNSLTTGGNSEPLVGKALRDGYRDKVKLATKLPSWLVRSREDMDRLLNEQLERLETDCIDFYLVHALNKKLWAKMKELGVGEFLDAAVEDGRIGHAGFSFHDDQKTFFEIVDGYDWSFCMFQYSYLDENYQAGKAGLDYAASKGLGIAVMEPLRGGSLAGPLPPKAQEVFDGAETERSPVEWALRWIWNHPEVSVVLSGMSAMDHVEENVRIAKEADAESLTDDELERIDQVKEIFAESIKVPCTACGYCMDCPHGVDIPANFNFYNQYFLLDGSDGATRHRVMTVVQRGFSIFADNGADSCTACGVCEEHCPQGIVISEEMEKVAELFKNAPENAVVAEIRARAKSAD